MWTIKKINWRIIIRCSGTDKYSPDPPLPSRNLPSDQVHYKSTEEKENKLRVVNSFVICELEGRKRTHRVVIELFIGKHHGDSCKRPFSGSSWLEGPDTQYQE